MKHFSASVHLFILFFLFLFFLEVGKHAMIAMLFHRTESRKLKY